MANSASGNFGPQFQSLPVAAERLSVAAHKGKCMAQTQVGGYQSRVLREGQFKLGNRLIWVSGGDHQLSKPHAGQRIHAVQADGFAVGALGIFAPLRGFEGLTQGDPGRSHAWRNGNRGGSHCDRSLCLPAGQCNQAHTNQSFGVVRVPPEGSLAAEPNFTQPPGQIGR